ncbi:hypothetical protein EON80_10815 [bacterium]|nr:MAG: hypothetical protein EON80_10815 [bacterium]
MKRCIHLFAFACLYAGTLQAHSEPKTTSKVVIKPQPFPGGKLGDTGGIKKAQPTGTRYRLHMSMSPITTTDDDGSFETYGTLKIDGVTWWAMPRATSNKGAQQFIRYFVANNLSTKEKAMENGYSFTKGNAFNGGRKFEFDTYKDDPRTSTLHIELKLVDADTPPGSTTERDDVFGDFNFKVNLSKDAGYYYFWKDGIGNGSDIWIYVEEVKDLYDSRGSGLTKVEIKPNIIKPDVVIKGPGPVIKRKMLKQ